MLEELRTAKFEYKKLTEDEMKKRGILGRLVGNVADCLNPTRNGRLYTEELWDKVLNNDIMKEKFHNKVMYGELCHPLDDRKEIDPEKIAVSMSEMPKKGPDGKLKAVFDIMNTPNGRILKTLCDYGSTLGISSRGTGDVIQDENGNEMVDPDTYSCECWDIVLVPAIKEARLQYMNEGLDKRVSLTEALDRQIKNSSEDDQKVMKETLKDLNIKLDEDNKEVDAKINNVNKDVSPAETDKPAIKEDQNPVKDSDIDGSKKDLQVKEAVNDGSEMVKSLTDAIKENSELESKLKSVNEQLAVSNAKVSQLKKEVANYKFASSRLSSIALTNKELSKKNASLEESLKSKTSEYDKLVAESKKHTSLNESISKKDDEIKALTEKLDAKNSKYEAEIKKLNESITSLKTASDAKAKELTEKLDKALKVNESYKKVAKTTVNKYIESMALVHGVDADEVRSKLPKNYTFKDIEKLSEDLSDHELNMSRLPFRFGSNTKMTMKRSDREMVEEYHDESLDVDEDLLSLAGLNK